MKISMASPRPLVEPCLLENHEYQIDPYVGCAHMCRYCYALNGAETDWNKEILRYGDIGAQLERELDGLEPQSVYLGYKTDPYQPCEKQQMQTRTVLEMLAHRGFSASVLTKSDLILRDSDLLASMPEGAASVSVAFTDEQTRKRFEMKTRPTADRIRALRELKDRGISTGVLICPVIPGISDPMALVEQVAPYADRIWVYGLSILSRDEANWRNVTAILDTHYPQHRQRVEDAVFDREHEFWADLRGKLEEVAADRQLNMNIRL